MKGPLNEAVDHLRAALSRDGTGPGDGQLLEAYLSRGDEAALEALVHRHAPMVWGVCRRLLPNHHDAEEAFQATFLILVRKAATVAPKEMVGNWLYGVARQTALKARTTASRRKRREKQVEELPHPPAPDQALWSGLSPVLDEELAHLPDRYRAVIVLCDLQGHTRSQAARQLGCPEGSVAGWLARARALLAERLSRRGVALSAAALPALLLQNAASARVPASLTVSTIQAALGGTLTAPVAALTEGVLNAMSVNKLKWSAVALLALALGLTGTSLLVEQVPAQAPPVASKSSPKSKPAPKKPAVEPEDEWGKPDGGVRLRARVAKKLWRADEVPEIVVDLKNVNGGKLALMRLPSCEVEVDGVWYVPPFADRVVAGAYAARNGDAFDRYAVVRLEGRKWVRKGVGRAFGPNGVAIPGPKDYLKLAPGKHTIRVASPVHGLVGDKATRTGMPITKAIRIEAQSKK